LAAHVVRIDCERGKLTILRRAPIDAGVALPLKRNASGLPVVEADVLGSGPPEAFVLATGFVHFSSGLIDSHLYDALLARRRIEPVGEGISLTLAGQRKERNGVLDRFTLGKLECRGLVLRCGADGSALGLHFLARHLTTFDFPRGGVYLQKNA